MEAAAATTSSLVLFSSPRRPLTSLNTFPSLLQPSCNSCSVSSAKQQHPVCRDVPRLHSSKKSSTLRCSSSLADGPSTLGSSVRWVLDGEILVSSVRSPRYSSRGRYRRRSPFLAPIPPSLICLRRPLWARGGWGLRNRRPVCIA
jgi:hypothetical protein